MAKKPHISKGDGGIPIDVVLDENVADATTLELVVSSPSSAVKVFTAALKPATTDTVRYTLAANDLDEEGYWGVQAHVVQPGGKDRSSLPLGRILVGPRLKP